MQIPEDDANPGHEPCFGQPRSPQTTSNTYEDSKHSQLQTSAFTCRSGKPLSVIVSHESGEFHSGSESELDFEGGRYTLLHGAESSKKKKNKKKDR